MKDLYSCSREDLKREMIFYKLKSFVISSILRVGLAVDYAWPFIFAAILSMNGYKEFSLPYVVEDKNSLDKNVNINVDNLHENTFLFSTAWHNIDGGAKFYRTEIIYKLKDTLDLEDALKVLDMSEEELSEAFTIESIQTFEKENGTNDYKYFSDLIVLPDVDYNGESVLIRTKTHKEENMLLVLIIASFFGGMTLKKIEELISNSYIKNKITGDLEKISSTQKEYLSELVRTYNRARNDRNNKYKILGYSKIHKS